MSLYNPFSLENKTILVTGASSGIGAQTAIDCSRMGAKVILLGRNSDRLLHIQNKLEKVSQHYSLSVDLTHEKEVENLLDSIKIMTPIHGVVNAAGISTTLPFKHTTPKKMEEFFSTNVMAGVNLSRLIISKKMISLTGSSFVFISSVMAMVGESGKSLYSLSKGAIEAVVRSLAIEFSSKNIRFNSISPAVVESPMSSRAIYNKEPETKKRIEDLHPLGIGRPVDISNACIYLLSDASRWVTGSNLVIDGGYTSR
jgi:NAD(P)-dependent dehydrogenase (short-subunit alcohol dehydrogenase family)